MRQREGRTLGGASCSSPRTCPNAACLGEPRGHENNCLAPDVGLLLSVFYLRHKTRAKQQIKLISVEFLQELLWFDSAVLLGFTWTEARAETGLWQQEEEYITRVLFFECVEAHPPPHAGGGWSVCFVFLRQSLSLSVV